MARRRKQEPDTSKPYPYDVDATLAGIKVRIKGERGILEVKQHEYNPRNGKHWLVLFSKDFGWRHVHPSRVTPVKRGQKLECI